MPVTTFSLLFAMLTVVANAGVVVLVILGLRARGGRAPHIQARLHSFLEDNGLLIAWLVALVATSGSLYYSEIANYTPCELCWFQRIAMYPLSVVLGIAYFTRDLSVKRYVLPVVAIGGSISIFHYVIQRFPDLISASCDPTAPCTVTWVWQFHYISIPFMALSGFALIATLLVLTRTTASVEGAPDDHLD
jgi:disulfide bond formation protein DsbB